MNREARLEGHERVQKLNCAEKAGKAGKEDAAKMLFVNNELRVCHINETRIVLYPWHVRPASGDIVLIHAYILRTRHVYVHMYFRA